MPVTLVKSDWTSGSLRFRETAAGNGAQVIFGEDDTGLDVKFFGETSGAYMLWDESADTLTFAGGAGVSLDGADIALGDSDYVKFGDASDVTVTWDGTNLLIAAAADDSLIEIGDANATQKSFDLKIYGNAASGAEYVEWDASSSIWNFGCDNKGVDVKFFGETASSFAFWDQSGDEMIFDGADLWLKDSDQLEFGDASDVVMRWDGTDFDITAAADDSVFKFGNGTNSYDVWIYGNSANAYVLWDASEDTLSLQGPARPQGFYACVPERFELKWVAGENGLVGVNADAQADTLDPRFELLGTNASADDCTFYAEGGLKLETDGADGDGVIILPHLDGTQSVWTEVTWGTDKQTHWECDITTGSAITNCIIWAGLKLTNTATAATDDDQCFFRYEDGVNGGKWQATSSIGGSDDEHDSGVTVATGTRYHFKIVIGSDRTAKMYINGALVETTAALTDATDLIPYIGVEADGAAEAKHLYVHGQAISRTIG